MIGSEPHENTGVAAATINIMNEEDDDDDDDDDDNCHGEDNDAEEGDVFAEDIVNNDGNDGTTIDSAVVVGTGTTSSTETEAVQKRRLKAKTLLKQVKFPFTLLPRISILDGDDYIFSTYD